MAAQGGVIQLDRAGAGLGNSQDLHDLLMCLTHAAYIGTVFVMDTASLDLKLNWIVPSSFLEWWRPGKMKNQSVTMIGTWL